MDPLLKATLVRTFAFLIWILLSAWLFTQVEYTGKDEGEEKHQLLLSLYTSMASKYNMTWQEFSNFSNTAYEVLSKPNPQWTFPAAVHFVVQAATTIGRVRCEIVLKYRKNLSILKKYSIVHSFYFERVFI